MLPAKLMIAPIVDENPAAEPRWIHDGVALWLNELRLLFVTMWAFVSSPRQFGAQWSDGKRAAMNPIGVVLSTATVLLPADYGLQRLLGWDRRASVSVWIELARASRPYLFAVLVGLLVHIAVRLLGSRRKLSTTVGLMLYVTALSWLMWCIGLCVCYVTGASTVLPNLLSMSTVVWAALALDGAHRIRWWWCGPLMAGSGYALIVLVNFVLSHASLS